jgi:transcriptional regulator with XRE-family HTH domain
MVETVMPIKDKLRELRAAADLSQQALAMKAGLSVSNVAQIESGKIPNPRMHTLRALAKALGVTLDELAGENGGEEGAAEPAKPKPARKRKGK